MTVDNGGGGGGGGRFGSVDYAIKIFIFTLLNIKPIRQLFNSNFSVTDRSGVLAAGPETARYQTIFRLDNSKNTKNWSRNMRRTPD